MSKNGYRISAIFFALWGLVHIAGGAAMYIAAAAGDGATYLAMVSSIPGEPLAAADRDTGASTLAVFAFHGFNLTWIGALVLVVAVQRNWRQREGFLLNTALVVLTDLGLLITTIAAGIMRAVDAAPGLGLAALAVLFALPTLFAWHPPSVPATSDP